MYLGIYSKFSATRTSKLCTHELDPTLPENDIVYSKESTEAF